VYWILDKKDLSMANLVEGSLGLEEFDSLWLRQTRTSCLNCHESYLGCHTVDWETVVVACALHCNVLMQTHTASVLTGWWQSLLTGCLSKERLGKGEIASWFDKKTRTRA
jgi:hypothetical protein